ncbi:hypothetical protein EHEL_110970 [Encephalitozoon hellem ATCC 50504]|uniref:Golgin subfamily A member 7/ERF4 domain-containing protein n=1 Tax=Encephalitozoon hellem TaxID=27973 RepID=A0A9Q9FAL0_ENCHE|nr:uncharacterized protein EHEL_110970 [Encephalitozoon hellem ATCC 50504]AFM99371.1 hypothetical protein EHEL_110970 [Encephalitozoon hellem ATCC 50504]UTX44377.1 hypothetical protein GPU96_11g21790 [Encephalitozoon hellem]|eukprot:XP_003888352.1 hypothetical protein EHEL_110970 [Encephalitozoon hellem ATCC 50504]
MTRKTMCIQIPRDPRVDGISFITAMPEAMAEKIEGQKWKEIMSGLNGIFHEFESPSIASFIKTVSIVPLLVGTPRNVYTRVEEYLSEANKRLERHGIRIIHPGNHQYVELEVEICRDE